MPTSTAYTYFDRSVVIPKASGTGILVDNDSPSFPWHDIIGDVRPKTTGSGTPTITAFKDTQFGYAFTANDVIDFVYHVPHDYLPNSHIYLHVHHTHNGTNISGTAEWTYYAIYGSRDGVYSSEATSVITYATVDLATTPQYVQRVTEIQLSTTGGSATTLNTSNIEVDGLIKVRLKLTTAPTVTGGSWFLDTADIHYQSTGTGTKNRASNFYS